MVLIAGYFWVNSFILDEFQNIKRNTVTAGGTSPILQQSLGQLVSVAERSVPDPASDRGQRRSTMRS